MHSLVVRAGHALISGACRACTHWWCAAACCAAAVLARGRNVNVVPTRWQLMCAACHGCSICCHNARWTHLGGARERQQLTGAQSVGAYMGYSVCSCPAKVQNRGLLEAAYAAKYHAIVHSCVCVCVCVCVRACHWMCHGNLTVLSCT